MPGILAKPMNEIEPVPVKVKVLTSRAGFTGNGRVAPVVSGAVPTDKKATSGPIKQPPPSNGSFTPRYDATVVGSSNALLSRTDKASAAKKDKNTNVVVWSLNNTSSKAPESFEAVLSTNGPPVNESVFEVDDRKKVNARDFAPGGKYRSIVKLFLGYQDPSTKSPRTLIATGWLIAPDLIVTAGHCVFDWEHNLNQVTEIKAYIGYNGRLSVGSPGVQFRKGIKIATTSEWLRSGGSHHDVSFIKVDKPFDGVKPFKYEETPLLGNMTLGVVGYPGDRDRGEHMYECFMKVKFDVVRAKMMLQYKIDTYGGNSGGPVLRGSDNVSIGVHVMGGKVNQATLIGKMGNGFVPFIRALAMSDTRMPKGPLQTTWLRMTAQPGEAGDDEAFEADLSVEAVDYDKAPESEPQASDESSEAYQFNKIVVCGKSFSQNFSERLSDVGLPASLGLSGKLAAIYAHALCHAVNARNSKAKRLLQEGGDGGAGTEASESLDPGSLGRGVLSEAALDALFSLDKGTISRLKVWDLMAKHAVRSSPRVEAFWNTKIRGGSIGAQLANAAISTATGALISGISGLFKESLDEDPAIPPPAEAGEENQDDEGGDGTDANPSAEVPPTNTTGGQWDGNGATDNMPQVKKSIDALIQKLLQSTKADMADKRLVSMLRETAVTESLAESMPDLAEAAEADEADEADEAEVEAAAETDKVYQGLKARLILGDAALETLLELTTAESLGSVASSNTTTTEGFWGKVWSGVKRVGKIALRAAPGLIVSAAGNALLKKITEASEAGAGTGGNQDGGSGNDQGDKGGEANDDPEHEAMDSFEDWMDGHSKQT